MSFNHITFNEYNLKCEKRPRNLAWDSENTTNCYYKAVTTITSYITKQYKLIIIQLSLVIHKLCI